MKEENGWHCFLIRRKAPCPGCGRWRWIFPPASRCWMSRATSSMCPGWRPSGCGSGGRCKATMCDLPFRPTATATATSCTPCWERPFPRLRADWPVWCGRPFWSALTETILQADQIQVSIHQQGLVTEAVCRQVAGEAAAAVQAQLESHADDSAAHGALFAQKAPLSHSHGAGQITAGTLVGTVKAQSNTAYGTAQLRNIVLSGSEPSGGSNGELWIKYSA